MYLYSEVESCNLYHKSFGWNSVIHNVVIQILSRYIQISGMIIT